MRVGVRLSMSRERIHIDGALLWMIRSGEVWFGESWTPPIRVVQSVSSSSTSAQYVLSVHQREMISRGQMLRSLA